MLFRIRDISIGTRSWFLRFILGRSFSFASGCEEWLGREGVVSYSRYFDINPIFVFEIDIDNKGLCRRTRIRASHRDVRRGWIVMMLFRIQDISMTKIMAKDPIDD